MKNEKRHIKIGIDEAGRGPWYGPVVACALAFDPVNPLPREILESIGDSKKISENRREKLFHALIEESERPNPTLYFWVGVVDNDAIDEHGIKWATREGMRRAIIEIGRKISSSYVIHSVLIDGNDHFTFEELSRDPVCIVRWDAKVKEIAGASIIAKVFRDELMKTYSLLHPKLGIEKHKWYGTQMHQTCLIPETITSFHRLSFEPIRKILEKKPRLLLHVCCGPDATVPLMDLKDKYDILAFWYDPNIQPKAEYEKRKKAFAKVCKREWIEWIEGEYDVGRFFEVITWLEHTPERWEKCKNCYDMRLERSAMLAHDMEIPYFTTTLAISPHKDLDALFHLGEKSAGKYGVEFLPISFRKNRWFERSVEYTKKHGIYRQSYCGCVYSEGYSEHAPKVWKKS